MSSVLPLRYYLYGLFWMGLGCQSVHVIYRPMKELEELYALKVELFKKNFDTIQELRAQLGEPQTGEKEEFSRVKVTSN